MAGWIAFLQNNIRLLKYSGFVMRSYDAFTASVTGVLQPRFQGLILSPGREPERDHSLCA